MAAETAREDRCGRCAVVLNRDVAADMRSAHMVRRDSDRLRQDADAAPLVVRVPLLSTKMSPPAARTPKFSAVTRGAPDSACFTPQNLTPRPRL
jgi:hypothetical protein